MAGKFRLEFHHISAFGRFKGRFEDVLKFYRHIIGDDVQIVTALREPTQQYVSWVLVYKPLLYHSSPPPTRPPPSQINPLSCLLLLLPYLVVFPSKSRQQLRTLQIHLQKSSSQCDTIANHPPAVCIDACNSLFLSSSSTRAFLVVFFLPRCQAFIHISSLTQTCVHIFTSTLAQPYKDPKSNLTPPREQILFHGPKSPREGSYGRAA